MNFSSDNIRIEHPLTQPITDIKSMVDREYGIENDEMEIPAEGRSSDSCSSHSKITAENTPTTIGAADASLERGVRDDASALRERYALEQILAVGGSGIVYKAKDLRALSDTPRYVALKTLRPELRGNLNAIEGLKREFRYAASAAHLNCVRVFDLERLDGTWFIAMELLTGESLATLLYDAQPECLPLKEILPILKACSRALHAAHQRGIVHCDFKPSNVHVQKIDHSHLHHDQRAHLDVRLLDFGAAHRYAMQRDGAQTKSKWLTGEPLLPPAVTPAYASPQMLTSEPPDPRDDVFSFACVAYEAFAGCHPFGRLNAVEMMAAGKKIARPVGMSLRRWYALQKGLSWQRELRPPTVPALMLEMDQHANAKPYRHVGELIAQWSVNASDWIAVRGFLGESKSRTVPQFIRISAIGNRYSSQRASSKRLVFVAIARRIERVGVVVVDQILIGLRSTGAVLVATTRTSRHRWFEMKTLQQVRAKLNSPIIKTIRARLELVRVANVNESRAKKAMQRSLILPVTWFVNARSRWTSMLAVELSAGNKLNGYRFAGVALILLAIAAIPFYQSISKSQPEGMSAKAFVTKDVTESPFWQNVYSTLTADLRQTHELLQLPLNVIDTASANSAVPMSFASTQKNSDKQAVARAIARKPASSVSLEHAHIDVSDQAIVAVLLLKRAGHKQRSVTVHWRTIVGSAKPGADYEGVLAGTARFADNQTVRTLYVPLKKNNNGSANRTFEVELSDPSTGATLGKITRTLVTIHKRES